MTDGNNIGSNLSHSHINSHIIEKLEGVNNYLNWKFSIKMLLTLEGLWKCVEGTDEDPTRDCRARARICLSIQPQLYQHVRECTTAKATWQRLADTFENKGLYRRVLLLRQLHRVEYQQYSSMSEYIDGVMRLVHQLHDIGKTIDDCEVAEILLSGLPQEFDVLVSSLETAQLTDNLSSELVQTRLLQEDHRRINSNSSAYFTTNKKKLTITCNYCKKPGHFSKNCYKKKRDLKNKKKEEQTLIATAFTASSSENFVIDSGATCHMTSNKNILSNIQKRESLVSIANGKQLHGNLIGKVSLTSSICLDDVIFVPDLSCNLLSVSQLANNGFTIVFCKDECRIFNNCKILGNQILSAFKNNGLYIVKPLQVKPVFELECSKPLPSMQRTVIAHHAASSVPASLWHKRLGHLSEKGMNILGGGNQCKGIVLQQADSIPSSCVPCMTGKMSNSSFPRTSEGRVASALDLVHSDVVGPMQVSSWGGANYLLTFTDDCTRKTWGYLMKHKSEVSSHFKSFKAMVEKQTGLHIKILRTDNGKEYCNNDLLSYLNQEGIIHQTTVPYCPSQNGVAERVNRTVFDKARSMLQESVLSNRYWGEAVMTAIYLKNRSPTSALPGNGIPEFAWTGRSVDLSHLRVFGCVAYALVPDAKRRKLDPKAKCYVFVGYGDNCKGYRLSDPTNPRQILYSRTVKFLETQFLDRKHKQTGQDIINDKFYSYDLLFNRYSITSQDSQLNECNNLNNINSNENSMYKNDDGKTENIINLNSDKSNCDISLSSDSNVSDVDVTPPVWSPLSDNLYTTADDEEGDLAGDDADERMCAVPSLPKVSSQGGDVTMSGAPDVSVSRPIRSTRGKVPDRYNDYDLSAMMAGKSSPGEPDTYQEAMSSTEKEEWYEAMLSEYNSLLKNMVWTLVDRPKDKNVVKCRWIYKKKYDATGKFMKHKARLVARGFSQKEGVDFSDTFSPVIRHSSLRILFTIATELDLRIDHIDVTTAFLNGELDEIIYMEQPLGFKTNDKVCLLHKSLYGLKQASRVWNAKIHDILTKNGYYQTKCEPCIYIKKTKQEFVIIGLYVDDLYVFHSNCIDIVLSMLQKNFEIRHLGKLQNCLGMNVTRKEGLVILDQTEYINRLLEKYNMTNCKPVSTPLPVNFKFEKCNKNVCVDDNVYKYRELLGSLMYLSVCTRPDISYTCSQLSQYNNCFDVSHWHSAKRVLRYLSGTKDFGLHFIKSGNFDITAYADADWANDLLDRRSYSGFAIKMGNSMINWEARKQRCNALSSTEAEYLAIGDVSKDICFVKNFMSEILSKQINVIVYNDSQSAQKLLYAKEFSHKKTKHIDLRYHFIKDLIQKGIMNVKYLETNSMVADVLTKPLCVLKHNKFIKCLNLHSVCKV